MDLRVVVGGGGHRLAGGWPDVELANRFLEHLSVRNFAAATRRAYAYDLLNFARFCVERRIGVAGVVGTDLFDYLQWQQQPRRSAGAGTVVRLADRRGAVPATMNRRIAAVRGLFEYAVLAGVLVRSPVPAARRSTAVRATRRGLLGHLGAGRPRVGGRLVRATSDAPRPASPVKFEEPTFLRAWRNISGLCPNPRDVLPLLFTVACRIVADEHRLHTIRAVKACKVVPNTIAVPDEIDTILIDVIVRDALYSLSADHLEMIRVVYYDSRSLKEAAAILGIPHRTVQHRSYYALKALRLALVERGVLR